ncbi:T9SS type A sorting domain-containing protein [Labilibacter sediminis]|nr:T9SS type A sorting domain-containing protein [Labilibacter sediminis]
MNKHLHHLFKSGSLGFFVIFLLFLSANHLYATNIIQKQRLEVQLNQPLTITNNCIYITGVSNFELQLQASESDYYMVSGETVIFNKAGMQNLQVNILYDTKEVPFIIKVNVLDNQTITFPNSDFDNAVRNFNITPWVFEHYKDASIEEESGNQFMRVYTSLKDSLKVRTDVTKYIHAEREGKYRIYFKARCSDPSNGEIKQFLTYGSNRQYLNYVNVCQGLEVNNWTEYMISFNTGFNGELGVGFWLKGKSINYDIDDIKVEKYNKETGLYELQTFENSTFDQTLNTDEFQSWGSKNVDKSIVDGFHLKAVKASLTGSNTSGRVRTGGTTFIPVKKGYKYTLSFYTKASAKNAELEFYLTSGSNSKYMQGNTYYYPDVDSWHKVSGIQITSDMDGMLGVFLGLRTNGVDYYFDQIEVMEEVNANDPSDYTNIFVSSIYGNDNSGDGSLENPFHTVQHALDSHYWQAGDKCYLLAGTYTEEVMVNNVHGVEGDPVVIMPFEGADVQLSGTQRLTGMWEPDPDVNGAWRLPLPSDVNIQQLWIQNDENLVMQTMARWPNVSDNFSYPFNFDYTARDPEKGTCWDYDAVWTALAIQDKKNNTNVFVDSSFWYNGDSQRVIEHDFTGGVIVLKMGYEVVGERIVNTDIDNQKIKSTSVNFAETSVGGNKQYFFITSHKNCLDFPGEWYYDAEGNYLYYIPLNGIDNPNNVVFIAKTKQKFFSLSNCSGLEIKGFSFLGTTLSASDTYNLKIKDCTLNYPSYVNWSLSNAPDALRLSRSYSPTLFAPADVVIYNCEFRYFDGSAIILDGQEHTTPVVENCLFHNGRHDHVVRMTNCMGAYFCRNTMYASQRGNGLKYFKSPQGMLVAEYNHFHNLASHRSDASCVQIQSGSQKKDTVRYNWFHDTENKGIRCDGEPGGELATHMYNVGWNLWQGLQIKGDDHTVVNNTFFDNGKRCDISVLADVEFGGNKGTRIFNNVTERMSGHRVRTVLEHPLPGLSGNNWNGFVTNMDVTQVLRDPYNLDFRPQEQSVIINEGEQSLPGLPLNLFYNESAPDMGAYEWDAENYNVPGRKLTKASTPVPPNESVTAMPNCDLMWKEGLNAVQHKVYLGANPSNLKLVSTQTNNVFDPGELDSDKVYFWRIDEMLVDGSELEGSLWYFVPAGSNLDQVSYPTSYEELFDYNADDSEGDPWNDILWVKDHVLSDKVELLDDQLLIDPAENIGNDDYMRIEALDMILRPAPLMQFDYLAAALNKDLSVSVRVVSADGKVGGWFESIVACNQNPYFENVIINIKEAFTTWDNLHGKENWTHLEEYDIRFSYHDEATNQGTNKIRIENFRLGFICLKDQTKELVITGQQNKGAEVGTPVYIGLPHIQLSVKIPDFPEGENMFEVINLNELSGTPRLNLMSGNDYNLNGNIVIPTQDQNGQWNIPLYVSSGVLESPLYNFKLDGEFTSVGDIWSDAKQLVIYPNPTSNYINVKKDVYEDTYFEIINLAGQVVMSSPILSSVVEVKSLLPGQYVLLLKSAEGNLKGVGKFIKKSE